MPGRFLVFMPTVDHVGVSRKIASREERNRLRGIVKEFREQHHFGGGVIIRTAARRPAEGRHRRRPAVLPPRLDRDAAEVGEQTRRRPRCIREPSLVAKLLRDLLTDDYTAIRIDDAREHQRVARVARPHHAGLSPRVKLHDKAFPIFEEYGVQAELDKALRARCG